MYAPIGNVPESPFRYGYTVFAYLLGNSRRILVQFGRDLTEGLP